MGKRLEAFAVEISREYSPLSKSPLTNKSTNLKHLSPTTSLFLTTRALFRNPVNSFTNAFSPARPPPIGAPTDPVPVAHCSQTDRRFIASFLWPAVVFCAEENAVAIVVWSGEYTAGGGGGGGGAGGSETLGVVRFRGARTVRVVREVGARVGISI